MTVARNPGEQIEGHQITYAFGRVSDSRSEGRVKVTLGLNGKAWVVKRWQRVVPGTAPRSPPQDFDELVAGSARGGCDVHRPDRRKIMFGAHRAFSGVLQGDAWLAVTTPA